jgi:uncharacterized OB-fold protein
MEETGKKPGAPVMEGIFTNAADGHPRLIGSQCPHCGEKFFPKRIICPKCFCDEKMEEILLGPRGKIYAFTTVRMPPPLGFEVPYTYGYVDLAEEEIKVPAMFTRDESDQLRIGTDVLLVIEKLRTDKEGNDIIGYKFKPIGERKGSV